METPEETAARVAAEEAAATGGFEDDTETVTPPAEEPVAEPHEDEDEADDEIEVPEGAENPDKVKNLIKAERRAAREANARARDLESQLRDLQAEKPEPEAPPESSSVELLQYKVALRKGLSETLAVRLQGTTEAELEADADALLTEVGTRTAGPGMDGGYKKDPPAPTVAPDKAHNDLIVGLLTDAKQRRQ